MIGTFDNFLDEWDFNELRDVIINSHIPWYFNQTVVSPLDKDIHDYQFTHTFFDTEGVSSSHFKNVDVVCKKIEKKLERSITRIRIKANLRPVTKVIKESEWHQDCIYLAENGKLRHTTAIFYVTTNNGLTILSNGDKIKNVANRLLVFDANEKHRGTTATDNHKIIINFNYY